MPAPPPPGVSASSSASTSSPARPTASTRFFPSLSLRFNFPATAPHAGGAELAQTLDVRQHQQRLLRIAEHVEEVAVRRAAVDVLAVGQQRQRPAAADRLEEPHTELLA